MMRLRDGSYAFGLHATMDGVQLALAVSTSLRKGDGSLTAEEPTEEEPEMEAGYGEEEDVEEDVEEEEDDDEDEEDEDEDEDEEGEEEEEGRAEEEEDEEEDAPLSQRRPRPNRRAVQVDDDDDDGGYTRVRRIDSRGDDEEDALSPASASAPFSRAAMPLKKRAAMAGGRSTPPLPSADDASGDGGPGGGKPRWQPRLDDAALCSVAVAVLCTLRRRGPQSADGLLQVTVAAMRRVPPMASTTPHDALIDTLRVLVRTGFLARKREATNRYDSVGGGRPALYALAPYGLEQMTMAASGKQPDVQLQPPPQHRVQTPAIGSQRPAIGSQRPAIGGAIGDSQSAQRYPPSQQQQQQQQRTPLYQQTQPAVSAASPRSSAPQRADLGTPPAAAVEPSARRLASVESSENLQEAEDEPGLARIASEASSSGKRKYRITKKKG